jgi:cysteine desulfurase
MSAVLTALGLDPAFGFGTLRFSTGRHTTAEEVDAAADLLLAEAAAQGIPVNA